MIRQLIHLGLVTQNIAQHSALQLTEAARPVLRGESSLQLAVPRIVALKPKAMQKSFGVYCETENARSAGSGVRQQTVYPH